MNCYEKIVDSTQGLVGYIQTDNKDISWRNYQSYDKIMNKSKMLPLEGISEKSVGTEGCYIAQSIGHDVKP